MSNVITISVEKREAVGTSNARRLRREAKVPAVMYGHNMPTESIQLSAADVAKIEGHTGLIKLEGLGADRRAILKEIQIHPINGAVLSVDFLEVKAGEKVTVVVPVESIGDPAGLTQGGQLEQVMHELHIQGDPALLPEVIKVDVSAIELNGTLTVADIKLADGLQAVGEADQIVFHVRAPHAAEAAPAAEDAADEKK